MENASIAAMVNSDRKMGLFLTVNLFEVGEFSERQLLPVCFLSAKTSCKIFQLSNRDDLTFLSRQTTSRASPSSSKCNFVEFVAKDFVNSKEEEEGGSTLDWVASRESPNQEP